jgi:cytochrome P450
MTLVSRLARRIGGASPAAPAAGPGPGAATILLTDPSVAANPWPHYEWLRAEGPILYLPRHGAWILLGFDAVKAAFAEPETFSSAPYEKIDAVLLAADPPGHEDVRRLVARRFTPALLNDLAAFAGQQASALIAPELDVVSDYAAPLTNAVAGRLIGFDEASLAEVRAAVEASKSAPDPLAGLIAFLDAIAPRAGCFAGLAEAVGDASARSLVRLLWLASTISTDRVIVRSILCFLEHPDLREAVAADRALLPAFIDEVTRLYPPELMEVRRTTRATSLGGVDIPADSFVRLCVAAANRDPARFEAPAEFRLDRTFRRQFTFGSGIHHCLGAPLARRIVAAALGPFLEPGRQLRAAEPLDSIPWQLSLNACTPARLGVVLG